MYVHTYDYEFSRKYVDIKKKWRYAQVHTYVHAYIQQQLCSTFACICLIFRNILFTYLVFSPPCLFMPSYLRLIIFLALPDDFYIHSFCVPFAISFVRVHAFYAAWRIYEISMPNETIKNCVHNESSQHKQLVS